MNGGFGGARGGQPMMDEQQVQEQKMIKMMQSAMESCPAKTAIAGTMGFGLGGLFGLFMSSMRYDTPLGAGLPGSGIPNASGSISDLPVRQQLKLGFKDMGRSAWSSAKNFGYIGGVFAGTECCIEGLRAKNDLYNGVAAGCFTGGWLARSGGPQAVAVGCAGFAAFSAAIDAYMRMEQTDRGADPIV
ncbi:Tim17-domain-containing protein [Teratosphaeria nubilosa]|uniref:Mitochondrial import inner membrane translocase subunit TIM22 n=1 Tax=Teratosphaeria nubilosa TaxID=161662 RepID=A0A6G1LAE2_9PEZI|nr:Tim17-domain-containing protein [Teratosphaeria nubilosa]